MSAVAETVTPAASGDPGEPAERGVAPSPAGPLDDGVPCAMPPAIGLPLLVQGMGFGLRPMGFNLHAQRRFGDVWQMRLPTRRDAFVVTCHPDHIKSLFTAKPDDAPSATGESPLRPILGPNSVLNLVGPRHMRQRKLLLPAFHGDAVKQYVTMIREVAEREIDRWQTGTTFALAPRMQAVTLDVIMAGIFGVQGTAERGTLEYQLRETLRSFLRMSTRPIWAIVELQNLGQAEPRGLLRLILRRTDRLLYEVIRQRRAGGAGAERRDVLSLLLEARDEDGRPLSDAELRDELATLVLAGHETTANSLAWTFERLVRFPQAYERLRDVVRSDSKEESEAYVEATIYEGMRTRPVIPMVVRLVQRPWQLGSYVVPARTPVAISIIGVHHRDDVYPEPYAFRPERFLGSQQPGTYTWIPFGGGIRRCLGAALAMAEQKVVLSAIAGRTDLGAPNPAPERGRQRNVTMIPARGGEAVLRAKRSG